VEWYHVCWPRLTAKRVEPVVSISWASCTISFAFYVGLSRETQRGTAPSASGTRSSCCYCWCWWTLVKNILKRLWLSSVASPTGNWLVTLFWALYCGNTAFVVTQVVTRIVRHFANYHNIFGQKVMETAPSGKGSRSDLPSELGFAIAPPPGKPIRQPSW